LVELAQVLFDYYSALAGAEDEFAFAKKAEMYRDIDNDEVEEEEVEQNDELSNKHQSFDPELAELLSRKLEDLLLKAETEEDNYEAVGQYDFISADAYSGDDEEKEEPQEEKESREEKEEQDEIVHPSGDQETSPGLVASRWASIEE